MEAISICSSSRPQSETGRGDLSASGWRTAPAAAAAAFTSSAWLGDRPEGGVAANEGGRGRSTAATAAAAAFRKC